MHVPAPTRAARVIGDEDDDDVTRAPTMVMAVFPKFNRLRREGALGRQVGYAVRALAVVAAAGQIRAGAPPYMGMLTLACRGGAVGGDRGKDDGKGGV